MCELVRGTKLNDVMSPPSQQTLLESRVFVGGVEKLHGTVSELQESAYQALLRATQENELEARPEQQPTPTAEQERFRPREDESLKTRDEKLQAFLDKTKRDLGK
ncbi:hypothetical protein MNV49_002987 [Pseudohyphozyma bogoriensis]|nr:hypothetical protein MNV49_002987 [Pseudohyphozyma bogoriensis]